MKGIYDGVVPPGWFMYPDIHPYSIGWRMGAGEWHLWAFWEWWEKAREDMNEDQRVEFFRRFPPPTRFLMQMMQLLWGVSSNQPDLDDYFRKAEDLGFGTKADYEREIEVVGNGGGNDEDDEEDEESVKSG